MACILYLSIAYITVVQSLYKRLRTVWLICLTCWLNFLHGLGNGLKSNEGKKRKICKKKKKNEKMKKLRIANINWKLQKLRTKKAKIWRLKQLFGYQLCFLWYKLFFLVAMILLFCNTSMNVPLICGKKKIGFKKKKNFFFYHFDSRRDIICSSLTDL